MTSINVTTSNGESIQHSSEDQVSSRAVSTSDSVTESSLLNSNKVALTENAVSNTSMFFGDDKGSHKLSSQTRTLGKDTN